MDVNQKPPKKTMPNVHINDYYKQTTYTHTIVHGWLF